MCQASPGPRCFNDSNKRLGKLKTHVESLSSELTRVNEALTVATKAGNASEVKKLSDRKVVVSGKLNSLTIEVRHTQRDVDGTLTGRKELAAALESARDVKVINELQVRLRAGAALRMARESALEWATSGRPAPIRLVRQVA